MHLFLLHLLDLSLYEKGLHLFLFFFIFAVELYLIPLA